MAKSSEEQAFEEILDYQEPVRPDPKEFYINSQGREVSLDFFLYSCLEEEKTCDALPEKMADKLTEKRWPPLVPYIREEVFDENDERVSTKEVADATVEELIKTICQWYRETYPQLAWDTPLDYLVHSELIEEFVLLTKDIKAAFKAKKVRTGDKIRAEKKDEPISEAPGHQPAQSSESEETSAGGFEDSNHSIEGEPDSVTPSESEAADVSAGAGSETLPEQTGEDMSADAEKGLIEGQAHPVASVEDASGVLSPESDKGADVGDQLSADQSGDSGNSSDVESAVDSISDTEAVKEIIPTYGEVLADCIKETFPAYSHLMVEYLSWSSRKASRAKPDLANIPPVGRFLSLLKKRSGAPRDRDFKDRDRSGSSGDGGRSSFGRSDRASQPRDRDRDRGVGSRPGRDRGERASTSRRESAQGERGRKDREEKAIQDLDKLLKSMLKNPGQQEMQLAPENSFIRRIQHKYIKEQPGFTSVSTGEGQNRAVMIQKKS